MSAILKFNLFCITNAIKKCHNCLDNSPWLSLVDRPLTVIQLNQHFIFFVEACFGEAYPVYLKSKEP